MIDKLQRETIAAQILAASSAAETEVLILAEDTALTRFVHGDVHQNVAADVVTIRIRVIENGCTGAVEINTIDDAALQQAVRDAAELARRAPRDATWPGLPQPNGRPDSASVAEAFDPATAAASAAERADAAGIIFRVAEQSAAWAAGYISTGWSGATVANSHGVLESFDATDAIANVKYTGAGSTGYGESCATRISAIDAHAVAKTAGEKVTASADPIAVEPGDWTVILEPAAFGELLSYLAEHFSAQSIDEGASFLDFASAGNTVTASGFSLYDDFTATPAPGMPFDYEGVPKKRLRLIENGVARDIATDSRFAARLNRENTGHAMPAPSSDGPFPRNLVVAAGTQSREELIASTKRGLLITRFWYIRPVDRKRTIVTGMTRDGTFLIENGIVGRGVHNLRFNQSILEALQTVTLGDTVMRTIGYDYSIAVPAAKIDRFHFSSVTSF